VEVVAHHQPIILEVSEPHVVISIRLGEQGIKVREPDGDGRATRVILLFLGMREKT
jgi:hypothetical protein